MFHLVTVVLSANELVYINAVLKKIIYLSEFWVNSSCEKKKTVWKLDINLIVRNQINKSVISLEATWT